MHIGDGRCGPENGFQCPYCEGFSVGLDGEKESFFIALKNSFSRFLEIILPNQRQVDQYS